MTTIKQVFLGAAVAGVLAGAGSAVGPALASADGRGPDTAGGASTSESAGQAAGESRGRSRTAAPDSARANAVDEEPRKRSTVRGPVRASSAIADLDDASDSVAPSARPAQRPTATVDEADPVVPSPSAAPTPAADIDEGPAPVTRAVPVAPAATAAVAVTAPAPIAVAPALTPAPAAPTPTPVRIPPLPDLPALPVAPASGVTVSFTSGTNTRIRAASAVAQAEALADPPVNHVLLIGTDGTNLSKVLQYAYDDPASGFRVVMEEGVTGATSLIGHTTISGPSWSTILTGAWDNKTGVINNLFNPAPYQKWPTAINLIEYSRPEVNTAVIADWQYINDIADAGGYPADINQFVAFTTSWEDTDDQVAAETIALINATDATESALLFSYQVAVDEAGHAHGGGSQQYADAVINTSENIKAIMDAVTAWEVANPGEQWTVIVTTDHGHQQSKGFGHGFQSPNETSSFVIFDLEGDDSNDGKQNLGYTTADITPTIVSLFGIDQRSDFDGVPLQTKGSGIVTPVNLKQALNDAISMYGYPNIGTDIALSTRTIFASIPYFIDGFVTDINDQIQKIVDLDIFLISGLAEVTQWIIQFNGDLAVGVTQALARVVAHLTGAGTIAPTDPPLPPPPANSDLLLLVDGALLT